MREINGEIVERTALVTAGYRRRLSLVVERVLGSVMARFSGWCLT